MSNNHFHLIDISDGVTYIPVTHEFVAIFNRHSLHDSCKKIQNMKIYGLWSLNENLEVSSEFTKCYHLAICEHKTPRCNLLW